MNTQEKNKADQKEKHSGYLVRQEEGVWKLRLPLTGRRAVSTVFIMTIDENKATERLSRRKLELEEQSRLASDARAPVELDQQSVGRLSRMDAMQQQAMAQASERARQRDLTRIELAERRLREGEYGWCLECGEEIPDRRLEIDPMAEKCVVCAVR